MKDIQNALDRRRIPIRKVGIKDLEYPVTVLDRHNKTQPTTARVNMYVNLPHEFKGTHMSRFVEILNMHRGQISVGDINDILGSMLRAFQCKTAHMEVRFPYFVEKAAPVSGAKSLMSYECALLAGAEARARRTKFDLVVEARVPVTTLCPCSKALSRKGAHNQRSAITISVRSKRLVWLEELIEIAESAASAPVYALLKRSDERYVTEKAYANPRFVEDVVRGVAGRLRRDPRIRWFRVESENFESIHNHSAYAMVESTRASS
jgi:GTP cyclohydrolase I